MRWKHLASWLAVSLIMIGPFPQLAGAPSSTALSAPAQQACVNDPGDDYTQTISGTVDGDPLQIEVSSRFGGAVDSLTWRGKQFINSFDHGREISYAWHMNDYGECLNPTEPGSADDQAGYTSTSKLLQVCKTGDSQLTTQTQMAYWLSPGESGFCSGGVTKALNTSVLSDHILEKTIQIGYQGFENVIQFTAVATIPDSFNLLQLEIPTGYLTYEFNDYWLFDPTKDDLVKPQSQELHAPWSFEYFGDLPPILSTRDGAYAMGAYTTESIVGYGIYGTNSPNPNDRTNKWHIVRREQPAPAGTYTYHSLVIVGTLEDVKQTMRALYQLSPVDYAPPTGFVDVANCDEIAGWAWDPKTPGRPIAVEFYALHDDGTESLLKRYEADGHRTDLVTALGDNGNHGFNIAADKIIPDNRPIVLRAYAVNSDLRLPRQELYNSPASLACPNFAPPPETAAAPTTESGGSSGPPSPTPVQQSRPGLPCPAAVLPFAAGVILVIRRSRLH